MMNDLSMAMKTMSEKTTSEIKADFINLYSAMPTERFFEHINNMQEMARESGKKNEREEIVCRLLANGMSAEEIEVILCDRVDNIHIIKSNHAATTIPKYTKKLKERRRRRERQAK
jgi:DNA-binding NarL/FixJ family response regulator